MVCFYFTKICKSFSAFGSTLALPAELWAGLEGHEEGAERGAERCFNLHLFFLCFLDKCVTVRRYWSFREMLSYSAWWGMSFSIGIMS